MLICIFTEAANVNRAKYIEVNYMFIGDLKGTFLFFTPKLKYSLSTLVWRMSKRSPKKYDAFLTFDTFIKKIPHLVGPGLTLSSLSAYHSSTHSFSAPSRSFMSAAVAKVPLGKSSIPT